MWVHEELIYSGKNDYGKSSPWEEQSDLGSGHGGRGSTSTSVRNMAYENFQVVSRVTLIMVGALELSSTGNRAE